MQPAYPKRLIEVDLPIKRISAHSRREKSIRHGHISTLHIWWARRPLAACRAVICAALWPDPADHLCPDAFREAARAQMKKWAKDHLDLLGEESFKRFVGFQKNPKLLENNEEIRKALFDFIADFSNWDNSTVPEYLETSRALTQAAHEALGGAAGTRPLVVDPFAGGGSIPLEALRVGADVFASDLNPVAVLLNKVVLEYIPKYGQRLADEVRKWGAWIKQEAEKELAEFYPKDTDGVTPIAYLWARTVRCEVAERTRHLFGKEEAEAPTAKRKKKDSQFKFDFAKEIEESEEVGGWGKKGAPKPGSTVLDRVHQTMILFAAGRTEAMKRFLVEEGAGNDARFWRLAQALSALYPASSEEKRWVDGVLARKKGLGF